MSTSRKTTWLLPFLLTLNACDEPGDQQATPPMTAAEPTYVGAVVCSGCHAEQAELWSGSHHELAMQPATADYVLGDFDNATFRHNGVVSSFYRREGRYFTTTDGPDGELAEYPVVYTFGVDPLQQYIVEMADGRLQALGIAWDSRPAHAGGQRWFHVYGDEPIAHDDVLHWTQLSQSWDSMCAECHTTGVEKSFDLATVTFATEWSEINVACEACHGRGSRHVAWAEAGGAGDDSGLPVRFDERHDVDWVADIATGNSARSRPRATSVEIDTCAPCHSRRSRIAEHLPPGETLLDGYLPALPRPPLYHADGQILDEVYVYGSFLQSRMYQKGVTCSDCHEPHSLSLRAPGSRVCLQCHVSDRFANADHQLLEPGSRDVVCVDCHMPETTYMQVDARRDHSFRVPRPDLSVKYGTPNACNACHPDKSAAWAVAALKDLDREPRVTGHWVESLLAAHEDRATDGGELLRLAADALAPGIIRATAITGLSMGGDPAAVAIVGERAASSDPLIRWAVARSLQQSHPAVAAEVGPGLLIDPVKGVRLEAVSALAPLGLELLPPASVVDLERGIDEYVAAQLVNAERPEAHINIGNLQVGRSRFEAAEDAYRTALQLNDRFVPAYVNLADLFRALGRDDEGEALLRQGLERVPADSRAALHYSLGLTLVRRSRLPDAIGELGIAANSAAAEPQYVLAYALALDAQGESRAAAEELEDSLRRFGDYPQLVAALVNVYQRMGDTEAAAALAARVRNR